MPAGPNIGRQAQDLLVEAMGGLRLRVVNSRAESDLTIERRAGRSADGWNWLELSGMLSEGVGYRARIMLIVRGATVVPIMAVAANGNGCVGLPAETTSFTNTITWAALYHSLKLAGSTPSAHLSEQIVGGWEACRRPLGHKSGPAREKPMHPTVDTPARAWSGVMMPDRNFVARGFTGEGRYVVAGNRLSIYPDRGPSQTTLIRIVEDRVANAPGRTTVQLCKINVDVGGPRERCLPRSGP